MDWSVIPERLHWWGSNFMGSLTQHCCISTTPQNRKYLRIGENEIWIKNTNIYTASNKNKTVKLSLATMFIEQKPDHDFYINPGISHNHNEADGVYQLFSI